jgi:hypothetical protein
MGLMSKEESQAALLECDLTNRANFKPYVQRDLENIFFEEPKKRVKKFEPVVETVVEPIVEEVAEPTVESHEVVTIENE